MSRHRKILSGHSDRATPPRQRRDVSTSIARLFAFYADISKRSNAAPALTEGDASGGRGGYRENASRLGLRRQLGAFLFILLSSSVSEQFPRECFRGREKEISIDRFASGVGRDGYRPTEDYRDIHQEMDTSGLWWSLPFGREELYVNEISAYKERDA